VDKDQATRDHLQSLHEKATHLSLDFSRNIQEGGKTIAATAAELDGLLQTISPVTSPTLRARSPSRPTSPTCSR